MAMALFFLFIVCLAIFDELDRDTFPDQVDTPKFPDRFPPISDCEFMALCPPGTRPEIALRVRRIVSEQLGIDYDCIYPSSRFVEDLGCD